MLTIKQGEDLLIPVRLFDRMGQLVDLTAAIKIRAALYVRNLKSFSYLDSTKETTIPGYGLATVNSTDNSTLDIYLTREQSKTFATGELRVRVLASYPDLPLEDRVEEYEQVLGVITVGYLKDEDLSI